MAPFVLHLDPRTIKRIARVDWAFHSTELNYKILNYCLAFTPTVAIKAALKIFFITNHHCYVTCYRYHYYGLGIKTTSRYYSKDYADKQANPAPKKDHSQKVVRKSLLTHFQICCSVVWKHP